MPANQERLTIADNASISTGNIDFTLVANVYLNNNTASSLTIVDKSNNSNTADYRLAYNATTGFRFRVGAGAAYVDSGVATANTWHTVIAWHDSVNDTLNIQVDNGTINTVAFSTGTMDTTNPVSIGAYPNGTYGMDGRVDEVALYKRVLTPEERAWLYNNGTGRTYADLTALDVGTATTYSYTDTDHAHAVKDLSTGEHYEYDANGNMILRVEDGVTYTQSFNAENRLIAVTVDGATTHFIYDGDGNLVKQYKPDGSRTLYVGGIYEVTKNSGGSVTGTKTYYPAAGAMRDGSTLYYVLKDHLGSASVLTGNTGALISGADTRYYPFGEARFDPLPMVTDKLFTGQRQIAGLGIYHYGARFYSPKLGRFLSADTIVPGYVNPQNLNRYSYVLNNPILYNDPSGHCIWDVCLVEVGVVLVLGAAAIYAGKVAIDNHDELAESITDTIKGWGEDNTNKKQKTSIEANRSLTADSANFYPSGFNPKPSKSKCGFWCKVTVLTSLGMAACVSMFEEKCTTAASNPNSPTSTTTSTPTLTPTPTATWTLTPTPTATLTSTPTLTPTPTSTNTSTPTSTPTSTTPSTPSNWWNNHSGVDEE